MLIDYSVFKGGLLLLVLLVSACVSFDKTNILPGQRVVGLGFSFVVPSQKSWFSVEYGTSHRIKLNQLNDLDSYSILISLNKGPAQGIYSSARAYLQVLHHHNKGSNKTIGLLRLDHKEWIAAKYGDLCIRYTSTDEDWRGRNRKGPAIINTIGLTCAHPGIAEVLIRIEISRRFELGGETSDLVLYADKLFSSVKYESISVIPLE